jgi:hypothetical protein
VARGGAQTITWLVVETPVWVGGSPAITAVAVIDRLIVPLHAGWRVALALGFIWTVVVLAVVPLRAGKRVPLAGAVAQVGLLGFFTAAVAVYAARHGVHGCWRWPPCWSWWPPARSSRWWAGAPGDGGPGRQAPGPSARSWARCRPDLPARSSSCIRQENPSASTTVAGAAARTAGSRLCSATATDTS